MAKGQQRSNREAKKPKKAAAAKGKPAAAGTMIETANANRKPPGKAR